MKNKNNDHLDELNNKRVESTTKQVAEAITTLSALRYKSDSNIMKTKAVANVVSSLEAAVQNMQWACKHYDWNDDVCCIIDDAIVDLGYLIAIALQADNDDIEFECEFECYIADSLVKLSKALAALVTWFDETDDENETN